MAKKEIKVEFVVHYKPTGKVFGNEPPIAPGIQGRFPSQEEAEEAMKKCLAWFNTRQIKRREIVDGRVKQEDEWLPPQENVVAWINEEHDGEVVKDNEPADEEDEECASEKPKKGKKEPALS